MVHSGLVFLLFGFAARQRNYAVPHVRFDAYLFLGQTLHVKSPQFKSQPVALAHRILATDVGPEHRIHCAPYFLVSGVCGYGPDDPGRYHPPRYAQVSITCKRACAQGNLLRKRYRLLHGDVLFVDHVPYVEAVIVKELFIKHAREKR